MPNKQRNGFPVFIRMAAAYRGLGQVPDYAHEVVIVLKLRNPESSGLPNDAEHDHLKSR